MLSIKPFNPPLAIFHKVDPSGLITVSEGINAGLGFGTKRFWYLRGVLLFGKFLEGDLDLGFRSIDGAEKCAKNKKYQKPPNTNKKK